MLGSALNYIENLRSIIDEIYNSDQTEIIEIKNKLKQISDAENALKCINSPLPAVVNKKKAELERELKKCGDPDFDLSIIEEELGKLIVYIKDLKKSGKTSKSKQFSKRKNYKKGEKTPYAVLEKTLISVLKKMGGRGRVRDIIDNMRDILGPDLTEIDLGEVSKGDIRWENSTKWIRNDLVKSGVFRDDSPRGIWELKDIKK